MGLARCWVGGRARRSQPRPAVRPSGPRSGSARSRRRPPARRSRSRWGSSRRRSVPSGRRRGRSPPPDEQPVEAADDDQEQEEGIEDDRIPPWDGGSSLVQPLYKVCRDLAACVEGLSSVVRALHCTNHVHDQGGRTANRPDRSSVLRAWERRYGVVTPERTPGGYRVYDEAALRRLRAMRRLIHDGWSASAAAAAMRGTEPAAGASPARERTTRRPVTRRVCSSSSS